MTAYDSIALFVGCGCLSFTFSLIRTFKVNECGSWLEFTVFLCLTFISALFTLFGTLVSICYCDGPLYVHPLRITTFFILPIIAYLMFRISNTKSIYKSIIDYYKSKEENCELSRLRYTVYRLNDTIEKQKKELEGYKIKDKKFTFQIKQNNIKLHL